MCDDVAEWDSAKDDWITCMTVRYFIVRFTFKSELSSKSNPINDTHRSSYMCLQFLACLLPLFYLYFFVECLTLNVVHPKILYDPVVSTSHTYIWHGVNPFFAEYFEYFAPDFTLHPDVSSKIENQNTRQVSEGRVEKQKAVYVDRITACWTKKGFSLD